MITARRSQKNGQSETENHSFAFFVTKYINLPKMRIVPFFIINLFTHPTRRWLQACLPLKRQSHFKLVGFQLVCVCVRLIPLELLLFRLRQRLRLRLRLRSNTLTSRASAATRARASAASSAADCGGRGDASRE